MTADTTFWRGFRNAAFASMVFWGPLAAYVLWRWVL